MVAFVLAVVAGLVVDLGLCRLMAFSRTAWPFWAFLLMFWIVALGVPCGQYPLVEWLASSAPALAAGVLLFFVGPTVVILLLRDRSSSWDRLQDRKAAKARNRAWLTLDSQQRSEVRRLARRGQLHPDPVIEALVREWAAETVESGRGQYVQLSKRIMAVENATPRRRTRPVSETATG